MTTNILIADDNLLARTRLSGLLDRHDGWKVCSVAENGQQAVAQALELKPDLIVLDLAMPVMNGLQAAREIARSMPAVPILIYTLHNSPSVEVEAKKAGARKVVFKPDVEALFRAIEEFVTKKQESMPSISPSDGVIETAPAAAMETTPLAAEGEGTEMPLAASAESDPTPMS